jgi:hypothetical protein
MWGTIMRGVTDYPMWRAGLAALMAAATVLCAGPAAAQTAPGQPAPDTRGSGPYPALKEEVAALPGFVVYRPANLAAIPSGGLGVYLFGNGGCGADGATARMHLLEIASHGYVAVAPGGIHSGPGATPLPPRGQPDLGASFSPDTPIDALQTALDGLMRENAREGSPFYRRINPDEVAASGHSCGGLQALKVAADPRVKTVVMMNSGLFPDGSQTLGGLSPAKASLAQLRGSVLYVLGGPEDIAYANGMDDFARIGHIPAAVVDLPVGHGGTFNQPNGGRAARIVTDWLQWRLRGDAVAAAQFRGPDCGLCRDAGVKLQRKSLD